MGTLVAVSCSTCAYEQELGIGCGMAGVEYEAMFCRSCRRIVEVAVSSSRSNHLLGGEPVRLGVCPRCSGDELQHTDINDRVGVVTPAPTGEICPSCRQGVLEVQWRGIWD